MRAKMSNQDDGPGGLPPEAGTDGEDASSASHNGSPPPFGPSPPPARPDGSAEGEWRWRYRLHPSGSVVAHEITAALDRQHDYLSELDKKASFVVAGAVAMLAGAVALGRWPSGAHAQDSAGIAVVLVGLALIGGAYTWWPRRVGSVPNPDALDGYWNAYETTVVRDLTIQRIREYGHNRRVESRKLFGLRVAIVTLPFEHSFRSGSVSLEQQVIV
jgi:hypothetical protein